MVSRRKISEEERQSLVDLTISRLPPPAPKPAPTEPDYITRMKKTPGLGQPGTSRRIIEAQAPPAPAPREVTISAPRGNNLTLPPLTEVVKHGDNTFVVPAYDMSTSPFSFRNISAFAQRTSVFGRNVTADMWNARLESEQEKTEAQKGMSTAERIRDDLRREQERRSQLIKEGYLFGPAQKFGSELVRGFAESVALSAAELGVDASELIARRELPKAREVLENLKDNSLIGENGGSVTYQDMRRDSEEELLDRGFRLTGGDEFMLSLGVLGIAASDLVPGGRSAKVAMTQTVRNVAKTNAPDIIRQQVKRNLRLDISDAGLTAIRASDDPVFITRVLEGEKKLADLRKIPVERRSQADIMRATQAELDIRLGYLSETPTYRRANQFPATSRQVVDEVATKGKYPSWLPTDLRSRRSVNNALKAWDNGIRPTRGRAVQIFDAIEEQVLSRMNLSQDTEYLKIARYTDEARRLEQMVIENRSRFRDNPDDYDWMINNRSVTVAPDYKVQGGKYDPELVANTDPAALRVYDAHISQVLEKNGWTIDDTGVWADSVSAFNRSMAFTEEGIAVQNAAELLADARNPLVVKGPAYAVWRRGMQDRLDALTRNFVNEHIDLNRFETQTLGRQADNPYAQASGGEQTVSEQLVTRAERARHKITEIEDGMKKIQSDAIVVSQKHGMETLQFNRYVGDYLHALHAPETNALHGAGKSGLTNAEAKAIRQGIEKLPAGADIVKHSQKLRDFLGNPLDDLLDAGYITREQYDEIMSSYANYVPLYRRQEGVTAGDFVNSEFNLNPMRQRHGSELDVKDIQKNIIDLKRSVQETIIQHEIDKGILALVDENIAKGINAVEKVKPRYGESGALFAQASDIYPLYTGGEYQYLKFKNPAVAMSLKGASWLDQQGKGVRTIFAYSRALSRFIGQAATSYNLTFGVGNMVRDMGEAYYYLRAEGQIKGVGHARFLREQGSALRDATAYAFGKDTAGARLYKEMVEHGGMSGSITNVLAPNLGRGDFDKLYEALRRGETIGKGQQVAETIGSVVKGWNDIFEGATRLNVYKRALKDGMSPERAGVAAKQATLNFDRRGKYTSAMGALYVFANAGAQGVDRLGRVMRNKNVAIEIAGTYFAAEGALNFWNDSVDPEWRKRQTDWERDNRWTFILPGLQGGGAVHLSLPVPIPFTPIKSLGSAGTDVIAGRADMQQFMARMKDTMLNAVDPIGAVGSGWTGLFPSGAKPFAEVAANTAWHGGPIWNQYADEDLPQYTRAFDSMDDRASGALIKELATQAYLRTEDWIMPIDLNPASIEYVIKQFGAGAYSDVVGTVDYLAALMNEDQPLRSQELPIVRRFYRGFTEDQSDEAIRQHDLREDRRETGKEKKSLRTERDKALRVFDKMDDVGERKALLDRLEVEEPALYDAMTKELKKRNLKDEYPKRVLDLGSLEVQNGQRAREMKRTLDRMKTAEEREEYLDQAEAAGYFSKTVRKQLAELMGN